MIDSVNSLPEEIRKRFLDSWDSADALVLADWMMEYNPEIHERHAKIITQTARNEFWWSIDLFKQYSTNYFFSPGATRAFGSKYHERIYSGEGGLYFTYSNAPASSLGRWYNVARFCPVNMKAVHLKYNSYESIKGAKAAAHKLSQLAKVS